MVTFPEACVAIILTLVVLLSVFTIGELYLRLVRYAIPSFAHGVVVIYWTGTILYACLWFIIGTFHLLNVASFWVVTALLGVLTWRLCVYRKAFDGLIKVFGNYNLRGIRLVVALVAVVLLTILVFSSFRFIPIPDESAYMWASPTYWASEATWSASPYRHSDGPILWNVIHTVFALSKSNAGAHLFNLSTLPIAALSTALIGQRLRVPSYISVLVVLGTPSLVCNSFTCATDLPAASLALFLIHIGVETRFAKELRSLDKVSLLSIWSIYSVKLTILPSFFIYLLLTLNNSFLHFTWQGKHVFSKLSALRIYFVPLLVSVVMWTLRNFVLTGKVFDQRNEMLATGPNHWLWHTGAELARIPDLKELLVLPILPLILPILGGKEPYGGRVGFAMLLLWPTMFAATSLNFKGILFRITQNLSVFLLVSSWITYSLVSILIPKTRYSAYVWPLMCISCISILSDRLLPKYRSKLMLLSAGLCLVSIILDEMRVLVAGLIGEYLR